MEITKMIKFIFCFLFLFSISTYAQFIDGYGFKIGFGISNIDKNYNNNSLNDESKWRNIYIPSIKVYANHYSSRYLQLQSELSYTTQGTKTDIQVTTSNNPEASSQTMDSNMNLEYLSYAFLVQYKMNYKTVSPYLLAGPKINLLLNDEFGPKFKQYHENIKKTNISVSLGVGLAVNVLPVVLFLEYRYENDLQNISKLDYVILKNYSHLLLLGVEL